MEKDCSKLRRNIIAKCFIDGSTLIESFHNSKMAYLKIYRDIDEKELSINFDNSDGEMGDECRRIEAIIFPDKDSCEPEKTFYILDSKELGNVIVNFTNNYI